MKICKVDGCGEKVRCKELCKRHYSYSLKHDELNYIPKEMHGLASSPEYRNWCSMKTRCYNPKRKEYKYYGGRGIKVCDRWLHSFENFLADMGKRPSPKHTIDRIKTN